MAHRESTAAPELPEGFVYQPYFLTESEQAELLRIFEGLNFEAFDFHGFKARRQIVEYGYSYDFGTRQATSAQPIPDFLMPLRERAAAFAGLKAESLVEAIVTHYPAGAPIGWHRDVPKFESIVGISLASGARMRFKPYGEKGKLVSVTLEPRSIYTIGGAARWKFQHSIPPVAEARYSITFRTLRGKRKQDEAA